MATHQTSTSSGVELEIHTEQAFSTIRPDILSLACVRGDPEALTYVLPVQTLRHHLTEDEQGLMRTPLWMTGIDLSFQMNGQASERGPMPILTGPNLVFDQDLMKGVTEDAEKMIEKVVAIYYRHRLSHCLVPGDILLLDNRRAVHGRSQFHPAYNGRDRFLIRCFGMYDWVRGRHGIVHPPPLIGDGMRHLCRVVSARMRTVVVYHCATLVGPVLAGMV
jgi:L-asparagine oxygenase